MSVTKHLIISGKVQGAFFRASMCSEAKRLGVTGWVRNRSHGTVEAMVQGTPEAVAAIIRWAQRGTALARVTRVDVTEGEGDYQDFNQLQSA